MDLSWSVFLLPTFDSAIKGLIDRNAEYLSSSFYTCLNAVMAGRKLLVLFAYSDLFSISVLLGEDV